MVRSVQLTIPLFSIGPYSISLVLGLLLYWNASLIISRGLTAFLATMLAMKLDLTFHLLFAFVHHVVAVVSRVRAVWDPQDMLNHFQAYSQLHVIVDIGTIALLVGNTMQYWTAALITRVALAALAARVEIWMRRWDSQSAVAHALTTFSCLACIAGCALQWAYYTLLPRQETEKGGFASLLLWYTSIVYIVAIGVRAACALTTALMRLCGYRLVQCVASKLDRMTARTLEDSGLNPHSEVHELYMGYVYEVACAVTAWYYAPPTLPLWMQGFVLLRLYLIASASGKLQRYKQVLDRFPSVTADPSKSCAICRDDFVAGEHVTCLPCGHTFHGACVRSWLMRASTCPTCRHPVTASQLRSPRQHQQQQQQQQQPTVTRGGAGGRFSGSVQPLVPRLPAAAASRTQPTAPFTIHRSRASAPPATSPESEYRVVRTPLPHAEELHRIEEERAALSQRRQHLLSPLSSPAVAAHAPTAQTESSGGRGAVDPFLFEDAPLAATAAEASQVSHAGRSARPKRRRPPPTTPATVNAGSDDDADVDGGAPRPRHE